ncbi:MAG: hypothetical protein L0Y76_00790, partial [Ignavibacteria bacterium]|nr:hypothetical protein [Ignavibacteria bacterium]
MIKLKIKNSFGKAVVFTLIVLACVSCDSGIKNESGTGTGEDFAINVWDYAENYYFLDTLYKRSFTEFYTFDTLSQFVSANAVIHGYQHEPFEVWMQCGISEPEKRFCVGKVMLGPRPASGYDTTITKPEIIIGDKFAGYFRKLEYPYEYSLDNYRGYIRLNFPLADNIHIGVVYKNASEQFFGKGWQESPATDKLILKLVKIDSQKPSIAPLAWQLIMKNIYKLPHTNLQQASSIFLTYNINGLFYHYIPGYSDFLVTMLKLDRYQNDTYKPPPDKLFDWLPSNTIFPQYGEIMFPVLEPFCGGLKDAGVSSQYWFCEIYTDGKSQTQLNQKANMYKLRGSLL